MTLSIYSLAMTAQFGGPTKQPALDKAYAALSQSLSGAFDPMAAASPVSILLNLATASTTTGVTMFDVLTRGYGFSDSTFDLLAAYTVGA